MKALRWHVLSLLALGVSVPVASAALRKIELETREVTEAEVAISPDGEWLVFTLLGHLFRLPEGGGTAEQLTFGPFYDTEPSIAPDGGRVAFVSDRDGSEGNIFVVELSSGRLTQLTREPRAGRPAWSPDGGAIAYLSFHPGSSRPTTAVVRRASLDGGESETLTAPPRPIRSTFYLPDGRLAWIVLEREADSPGMRSRLEAMTPQGSVAFLRTIEGFVDVAVASPTGDSVYCRRSTPTGSLLGPEAEDLLVVPLSGGLEQPLATVSDPGGTRPRFAVSSDDGALYLGDSGRLWRISLPLGIRKPVGFSARVQMEIEETVRPPLATFDGPRAPLTILTPRISPDGRTLAFVAAGSIWLQPLGEEGGARKLHESPGIQSAPEFSPNGGRLVFVQSENRTHEIRIFDFASGEIHSAVAASEHSDYWSPAWSPDGEYLVFVEYRGFGGSIESLRLADRKRETLSDADFWSPRPHLSADGRSLYYSANTSGTGALYRKRLTGEDGAEPLTELERHLSDGLVSPDEKTIAFRRNSEIWVATLGPLPVQEEGARLASADGGETYSFTPDGKALIYSVGQRVFRHPLAGGARQEIPIRIDLKVTEPPPLLLRRVRVLDLAAGRFGEETTLFIEGGRIRPVGSESGSAVPPGTVTLDASGRFAIPGLFDMHVHAQSANHEAFLAYGVTSVRDTGGSPEWLSMLSDRRASTSEPIPRYFFAGRIFEGARPFWGDGFLQIYDEEEAAAYVRRSKEVGARFIKVYPSLSWPLQRAVAEEARRVGLPVAGHGTDTEQVTKSVTLGYSILEHGISPTRAYDDLLQLMAKAGTRWDPTMAVVGGDALLLRDEPERLADEKFLAFTPASQIYLSQTGSYMKSVSTDTLRGAFTEQLASIAALQRRGVKLLAGTDAPNPECFFGSSLHWELEFFVRAGLTPIEVLRIATENAAEAVGARSSLGTIEVGKLADIVLLNKDPLEEIRNTQSIWRTIRGGAVFDPEKLRPNP